MEQHMPVSQLFICMLLNLVKHLRCAWPGNRWNATSLAWIKIQNHCASLRKATRLLRIMTSKFIQNLLVIVLCHASVTLVSYFVEITPVSRLVRSSKLKMFSVH